MPDIQKKTDTASEGDNETMASLMHLRIRNSERWLMQTIKIPAAVELNYLASL
jgi:hypothetical protein